MEEINMNQEKKIDKKGKKYIEKLKHIKGFKDATLR